MTAINSNRAIRGPVTAVPVVAGKGVRLVADTENNRWVVEADETVVFNGTAAASVTCSETLSNFSRLRVYVKTGEFTALHEVEFDVDDPSVGFFYMAGNVHGYGAQISVSSTTVAISGALHVWFNAGGCGSENVTIVITKVVGINRVSGGN